MKALGWFKDALESVESSLDFKLADLELKITERIIARMEERRMNRADLARELGISKAAVSKFLNNGSNITVKTLLKISEVLDCELKIRLDEPIKKVIGSEEEKVIYPMRFNRPAVRYTFSDAPDDYHDNSSKLVNYA